jgi:hypothetical protein
MGAGKKKRGAAKSSHKSLSERQNVAPGTKAQEQPAAGAISSPQGSISLQPRARQLPAGAGKGRRQGPAAAAAAAGAELKQAGIAAFEAGAEAAVAEDWKKAYGLFLQASKQLPDAAQAWHYRALAALKTERMDDAVESAGRVSAVGVPQPPKGVGRCGAG